MPIQISQNQRGGGAAPLILVLYMDIQMPVIDGIEAIKQIRLNPDLVNIPIVALTALAMVGDREKCLASGASDYLAKPFKLYQIKKWRSHFLI